MRTLLRWGGPILEQALTLGLLACLVVLPIVAYLHRRRHGTFAGSWRWRAPLVILYLVGIVSFTFLPLPDPHSLVCNGTVNYPRFFAGWSVRHALRETAGSGPLGLFTWYFVQIYLNILLFVPWGVAARWFFRSSLRTTFLSAFAASLLIELTQLTGVWGYFDCRYRTFDVGDMITNTLGAIIGWLLVWVVTTYRRARVGARAPRRALKR